jgi:hypothetical protein
MNRLSVSLLLVLSLVSLRAFAAPPPPGTLNVTGTTSGVITIAPQAITGTYNFNLPTTAGSAGQVLTSQGGGGTAMTWSNLSSGSGTVSSGAQYQMGYYAAGGTTISGDANITTDASNDLLVTAGRVGIGTAVPSTALDVNGSITTEGSNGLVMQIANDASTGTSANHLAKLSTAGKAVIAATGDSDNMVGIVIGGAGTGGNAQIAVGGTHVVAGGGLCTNAFLTGSFPSSTTAWEAVCFQSGQSVTATAFATCCP